MRPRVLVVLFGALLAFFGASLFAKSALAAPLPGAAPLCDDRAASAYAPEPAPQPVDAGDLAAPSEGPCKVQLLAAASASSHDDLKRPAQPSSESSALLPTIPSVDEVFVAGEAVDTVVRDGPADEHRRNDNPPPRPIPWRA